MPCEGLDGDNSTQRRMLLLVFTVFAGFLSVVRAGDTLDCSCSLPNKVRIRGGVEAKVGEYPWLVAVRLRKNFDCGGALINDRYILTAGHCINERNTKDLDVVVGAHDENNLGPDVVVRNVIKTWLHPEYRSAETHDSHDIGLLLLDKPVDFCKEITPICLPSKDQSTHSQILDVAGWGIADDGDFSNLLLKAKVTSKDKETCLLDSNYTSTEIEEDHFCAAGLPGVDSCTGDSGGPAMLRKKNKMYIIGIVSWGYGCADDMYPGVYVSVPYYLDWIKNVTFDGKYCKD